MKLDEIRELAEYDGWSGLQLAKEVGAVSNWAAGIILKVNGLLSDGGSVFKAGSGGRVQCRGGHASW
jgi:hypothetical protein